MTSLTVYFNLESHISTIFNTDPIAGLCVNFVIVKCFQIYNMSLNSTLKMLLFVSRPILSAIDCYVKAQCGLFSNQ